MESDPEINAMPVWVVGSTGFLLRLIQAGLISQASCSWRCFPENNLNPSLAAASSA
jgi:hypothetical protein